MLDHTERVAAARAAVDYITGRSTEAQRHPVPNCPVWTGWQALPGKLFSSAPGTSGAVRPFGVPTVAPVIVYCSFKWRKTWEEPEWTSRNWWHRGAVSAATSENRLPRS